MSQLVDLTNKKFGNWTVLGRSDNLPSKATRWMCKCVCGRLYRVTYQNLTRGTSTRCKQCADLSRDYSNRLIGYNSPRWKGYMEITGCFWCSIKKRARKRGLEFEITKEYAYECFLAQNGKCAFTGIDLVFSLVASGKFKTETTASLDRIDSNKGYVEGNIQWVHKIINCMKQALSDAQFIDWCEQVTVYRRKWNRTNSSNLSNV